MKKLFFIALALNALFFAWQVFRDDTKNTFSSAAPASSEQEMLILLKEKGREDSKRADRSCYAVGPFSSYSKAMSIAERLTEGQVAHTLRKKEERHPTGYWIYLPASQSREEAKKVLRNMHAAGIDSFIVLNGKHKNAISVGVYNNKQAAVRRTKELNNKGFPVKIAERLGDKIVYWLDIKEAKPDIAKISVILGPDVASMGKHQQCG